MSDADARRGAQRQRRELAAIQFKRHCETPFAEGEQSDWLHPGRGRGRQATVAIVEAFAGRVAPIERKLEPSTLLSPAGRTRDDRSGDEAGMERRRNFPICPILVLTPPRGLGRSGGWKTEPRSDNTAQLFCFAFCEHRKLPYIIVVVRKGGRSLARRAWRSPKGEEQGLDLA